MLSLGIRFGKLHQKRDSGDTGRIGDAQDVDPPALVLLPHTGSPVRFGAHPDDPSRINKGITVPWDWTSETREYIPIQAGIYRCVCGWDQLIFADASNDERVRCYNCGAVMGGDVPKQARIDVTGADKRLEELQAQMDELRAELQRQAELRNAPAQRPPNPVPQASMAGKPAYPGKVETK